MDDLIPKQPQIITEKPSDVAPIPTNDNTNSLNPTRSHESSHNIANLENAFIVNGQNGVRESFVQLPQTYLINQ